MGKYYGNAPRISTEYRDCSMPFAFDQHKGCGYQCIYCFAYYQRYEDAMCREDYQKGIIKSVDVNKVLRLLEGESKSKQDNFFHKNFIAKRKVIQWGALGDPFCPIEQTTGAGLNILRKLSEMKYPVSLSTKSAWFVDDEGYFKLFKATPETFHVKFSIITSDKDKAALLEKGTPTPKERFGAMKKLSDIGVATTLRLRPFLIGLTNLDLEDTIKSASKAGAISVSTEFFCLDVKASAELKARYKEISEVLGFNVWNFYKKHSHHMGYRRLNRGIKQPHMDKLRKLCKEHDLKLYVSDPDFKEISHHGACCGLPQTKQFENYYKAQLCELLVRMRKEGIKRITWKEYNEMFKDDFEWQKEMHYCVIHNAGSGNRHHLRKNLTLYQFNKNCWNNPKANNSPYQYFGGTLKPVGLDDENNIVYEYTGEYDE